MRLLAWVGTSVCLYMRASVRSYVCLCNDVYINMPITDVIIIQGAVGISFYFVIII